MKISEVTKKDIINILNHVILFFKTLSQEWKEKFLDSLNKNPLKNVIQEDRITSNHIYNFNRWERYFAFHNQANKKKVVLIQKAHVLKILENMRKTIINDMVTNQKFKLN